MESEEDKQLARLYDYTKFHIGIYLSFAGGLAALLGSEKIGWFLSALIAENRHALIWALGFMVLAGMCGGVVATSVIECKTFADFWEKRHGPQIASVLSFPGRVWAALEHFFFWISLIVLGVTVVFGFAKVTPTESRKADAAAPLPCYEPAPAPTTTQYSAGVDGEIAAGCQASGGAAGGLPASHVRIQALQRPCSLKACLRSSRRVTA